MFLKIITHILAENKEKTDNFDSLLISSEFVEESFSC